MPNITARHKMKYKFNVVFLEPVMEFLGGLEEKSREKILYNIWKSRSVNDPELFKKLSGEIWEFRTLHNKAHIRLMAFWDKSDKQKTVVISTHGFIKKTDKTSKVEIEKAENSRLNYLAEKQNSHENI